MSTNTEKKATPSNVKIRKTDSIMMQVICLNLVMLLAFILVMAFVMNAMVKSTNSSIEMFDSMMVLTQHEANLKTDVMSLYDQVTGYVSADAVETKEALLPQIEVAKQQINADISELNSNFASYNDETATEKLAEISEQYARLVKLIDQAIEKCDAGDKDTAYKILFDKAEIQKIAIFHSSKVLDEAINNSANQTTNSMQELLRSGNMTAGIGIIVIIIIIILNFFISYKNIVRKIRRISDEVNDIITNIENGNGDLTARIHTKTKSELLFITTGINHFIETLQGIMKDVKNGSTVLISASEEVVSELKLADDNVTNTSAALEELSANMETVSTTLNHINGRVEDVKEAAVAISEEAEQGTETANSIKKEANELKIQVNAKKTDAADLMDDMLTSFTSKAENLNDIMTEMVESIQAITNSVQESSTAISMSAASSTEIVGGIKKISKAIDKNNTITEQLSDTTEKFTSL